MDQQHETNSTDIGQVNEPSFPNIVDTLSLPEDLQQVLRVTIRERDLSSLEISNRLGQQEETILPLLSALLEKGFVQEVLVDNQRRYRAHLAPKNRRKLPDQIWQKLEDS
jgi:transcription initiation factor IIE alpha subunit